MLAGLTLGLSIIGLILAVLALARTFNKSTLDQEGERNRQLQRFNSVFGAFRGNTNDALLKLKAQVKSNEEDNEILRNRVFKLEEILRKFAHSQRRPWSLFETEIGQLGNDDKEDDEDDDEEEMCAGCDCPKDDCQCEEDEDEEDN